MPDDTKIYSRSTRADSLEVGDRFVIYDSSNRTSLVLNPTGAIVWNLLASPQDLDQLTQGLATKYPGVDEQSIAKDVADHLAELTKHGVVVVDG